MPLTLRKLKNFAHLILAISANFINLFPGKNLTTIGVTGTDGKTTTSNLIYHILKNSGKKVALISTLGAVIDGKNYETGFHVTTPSPFSIQKYLRIAKEKGCTHVVLEVTSHAIDQNRIWGINFDIGVLTNVTHEHLDYHKSYSNYVKTKLKLLRSSRMAIANSNGEWFNALKESVKKSKLLTYSLHNQNNDELSLLNVPFKITTNLIGDFNMENILAAILVSKVLGIEMETVRKSILTFEPPEGRQEIIKLKNGPAVMIDFAHTANSFESILSVVRKEASGKLIHVFGCAGRRDIEKRSQMGKVAAFYDDIIILTAEDPRDEKISDINLQIKEGMIGFAEKSASLGGKTLVEIDDRRKAIEYALSIAKTNDMVIVTGKGHEKSINYGRGEVPWSDKKVVMEFGHKK